jgi:hypothetical protein
LFDLPPECAEAKRMALAAAKCACLPTSHNRAKFQSALGTSPKDLERAKRPMGTLPPPIDPAEEKRREIITGVYSPNEIDTNEKA